MQRVGTVRPQQKKDLRQANDKPEQPVGGRTALGREESRFLEAFYEHSLDLFETISPEGKITDVNQATETATGLPSARLIGTSFSDYFMEWERADAGYQLVMRAGFVRDFPLTIRHVSGRTIDVLYNAVVYRNEAGRVQGVFAAARAVTERNRAETELARYRDHLEDLIRARTHELETANADLQADITERKKREAELDRLNRTLKALGASSQAMMRATDESAYLNEVCQIIVRDGGHSMVWIGFVRDDPERTVQPVAQAGFDEGYLKSLQVTWADTERGRGPTGTAIRTGTPSGCRNMQTDPNFAPWREEALRRGYVSSIVVPLMEGRRTFGTITIYSGEPDFFTPEEVGLLSELADDVRYGISALRLRRAHAQAEEALRDREQELAAIYENAPLIILLVDGERRVHKANRQAAMFAGGSVTDLFGRAAGEALRCLRATEDRRGCGFGPQCGHCALRRTVVSTLQTGSGQQQAEVTLPFSAGRGVVNLTFLVSTLRLDLRGEPMALVTMQDITQRKHMEEALQAARAELEVRVGERTVQLRALAAELTQSEERERRRIAQILHDDLQQLLVAARLRLEAVRERKEAGVVVDYLLQIEKLIGESNEIARGLSHELSPTVLHEHGLLAGLQWLGRWMHEKHGLMVRVGTGTSVEALEHDVKVLLFQSVRELLFNVIKHAGVKRASVRMSAGKGGAIEILVSDRGRGIDPVQAREGRNASMGFGLFGIRERLAFVGGRMEVESKPGGGARFRLVVPLPGEPPTVLPAADRQTNRPPAAPRREPAARHGPRSARPQARSTIRVLLADDHKIMRDGLALILNQRPGIEVVGMAADGQEAVTLAEMLQPQVVIMDVSMPRLDGMAATRQIVARWPQIKVIGLTMHSEDASHNAMRAAGAAACLAKSGPTETLVSAICTAMRGTTIRRPPPAR
jgi:PAS domain S-box-containing protein